MSDELATIPAFAVEIPPSSFVEIIETVITTLSQDATQLEIEAPQKAWRFHYGTVEVFIYLTGLSSDDTIIIWSPVIELPVKDETALMRYLLNKNGTNVMMEASFCIQDGRVLVNVSRTLTDLNPSEISRAITVVASIADEYDEILIEKFN
jgi:Putative bacterial sensory transduction regulator